MKATLKTAISDAIQAVFGISDVPFTVEHPAELMHGDYMTNAALIVAKQLMKTPREVADALVERLNAQKKQQRDPLVVSFAVAGPGFINVTLSLMYFSEVLANTGDAAWGHSTQYAGKKIVVEHSSPNLFKPFHIGHVMNNAIGESIVRLARSSGAQVTAISYPSDISLGIGKAIWAMLQEQKNATAPKLDIASLGNYYVEGTKAFDQEGEAGERVQEAVRAITANLYNQTPSPELDLYHQTKRINLDYFEAAVARLGSKFDAFIYESEAGVTGAEIVRKHTPGIFEESDGAIIYKGEQDGLHTRVFINAEGFPTYEAKDIGLLSLKFSRFNPDRSIFITDHQQSGYFEVVLAAAGKIDAAWRDRSVHRTHGRMAFKGQKMSSRLGGVPTADDVLDAVKAEVQERSADLSPESQEAIAIGALKFVILRAMAGKNINFDPDTSLSFEGDSGPYLQYTAVRAASVLAKAKAAGFEPKALPMEKVTSVERLIARYPDIVERSISEWAPHHIVGYLLELAQAFNSWYGNTKIIDESDPHMPHRLAITKALADTITSGLWILGISVPEKM